MPQQMFNDYVIISKDASTDINDGMVTLYKIVDKFEFLVKSEDFEKAFNSEGEKNIILPAVYTIASSWSLNKVTEKELPINVKVSLKDPDNKVINEMVQEAVVAKGNDKLRLNINAQGLPMSKTGRYTFEATASDLNGKEMARGKCSIVINLNTDKDTQVRVSTKK